MLKGTFLLANQNMLLRRRVLVVPENSKASVHSYIEFVEQEAPEH